LFSRPNIKTQSIAPFAVPFVRLKLEQASFHVQSIFLSTHLGGWVDHCNYRETQRLFSNCFPGGRNFHDFQVGFPALRSFLDEAHTFVFLSVFALKCCTTISACCSSLFLLFLPRLGCSFQIDNYSNHSADGHTFVLALSCDAAWTSKLARFHHARS